MQKIAEAGDYKQPAAIEDPAVLDEIKAALHARGLL
jgi:propionyl-CoA synthetase